VETSKKRKTAEVRQLTLAEQEGFRKAHLPHRLTLLRTFRDRVKEKQQRKGIWQGEGDIYRCLKDSALISIRLFLEAMGLQGCCDTAKNSYLLTMREGRRADDVWIDQLGGMLVDPGDHDLISDQDHRILAGIYCRASKELAHLTVADEGEFNTEEALIRGVDSVERLLRTHLYEKVGWEWPPRTTDD
jgi:hypothetical protein